MPIIDCNTLTGFWPHADVDLSAEALLEGMKSRQVSRSFVTHTAAMLYDTRVGNDAIAHICGQNREFTPVAVLNPLDFPDCIQEAEQRLSQGFRIFRLCPYEHGYPLSAQLSSLTQLLAALQEEARLILVDASRLAAPAIEATLATQLETPMALTVTGAQLGLILSLAKESEHLQVETSYLAAGGAVAAALRHLGAERVLFGSGAPLLSLSAAVMSVQYAEIGEIDRLAVFEGNAMRFLQ